MPSPLLALLLVLQQQPAAQQPTGNTSPANGDTTGYWQQRIAYRIVARLDESAQRLLASGELTYVNNSPDTLREMYVHQYLNAFRPQSKWSRADEREGRVRFQYLADPDFGYEHFSEPPTVDGVAVSVEYPGSPDSTVARFALPRPLMPGDSVVVRFRWEARPSTVTRRQGRRGRSWDFAQWYPKVAVYDRGGWQPNALVPAGEFYGEFGTYDVTTIVRDDQVVGSTGVPVSGDPGWERVRVGGAARVGAAAYGELPPGPAVQVPAGYRAIRWLARDVHHFGWSASPDYRYEGGVYVRDASVPGARFRTWDTVAVHALFRPGDDSSWGGGRVVGRTQYALRWLESIYGPYVYPQMTVLHRLDPGGTEFPMMQMNGSASQGLILHEGGHVYSYGILANNEWRSGWMDEGLTSYQTSWALGQTPMARARRAGTEPPARLVTGYRANAVTIPARDSAGLAQWRLDVLGLAEPIGTRADEFSEFAIYNSMIYDRAELMYGQLHDAVGDTAFRAFLRDYYARWGLRHVDERAMRGSAERSSGRALPWFFEQWVRHTGLLDYAMRSVDVRQVGARWVTRAVVERRGAYRHPIPVGVRTASGWVFGRGDPLLDAQTLEFSTAEQPLEVRIDPLHTTWDWDRRNDRVRALAWSSIKHVFDWPFLEQSDRERRVARLLPMVWYSDPQGIALGLRSRSSYLTMVDRLELGGAVGTMHGAQRAGSVLDRLHAWVRLENPYLPGMERPLLGHELGIGRLDGVSRAEWTVTRDLGPYHLAPRAPKLTGSLGVAASRPFEALLLPENWDNAGLLDLTGRVALRAYPEGWNEVRASLAVVGGFVEGSRTVLGPTTQRTDARGYLKLEADAQHRWLLADTARELGLRVYAGAAVNPPRQRALYASHQDPMRTYWNHWYRPRGAIIKQLDGEILGGPALRGYRSDLALERVVAANGELAHRLLRIGASPRGLALWLTVFGDLGVGAGDQGVVLDDQLLVDAGAGLALRGRFFDRDVRARLDFPLLVRQPTLALVNQSRSVSESAGAFRWTFTLTDIW